MNPVVAWVLIIVAVAVFLFGLNWVSKKVKGKKEY